MLRVVLVEPEGCENVGRIARLMNNFGLDDLVIVSPKCDILSTETLNYAVHSEEILKNAKIYNSLKNVISDCDVAIAFSRRIGQFRRRDFYLPELGEFVSLHKYHKVALVFGREKNGLTNEEINLCDVICVIPTSESLPSINLAEAVGIVIYELFKALNYSKNAGVNIAKRDDIEKVLDKIISFLNDLNYFKNTSDKRLKNLFRKFFFRARLDIFEIKIIENIVDRIRGMLIKR